jgi:hypothetical protein
MLLPSFIGIWSIVSAGLGWSARGNRTDWIVALFHAFLIGTSFLRERGDRHMFEMRQQLKLQFR